MTVNESPSWWKNLEACELLKEDQSENDLMHSWQGTTTGFCVPDAGWRIALSHKFSERPISWSIPPLSQLPSLVGFGLRYLQFYKHLHHKNKKPCMDIFNQIPLHQIYGVPLGGIGGGTINRGWKGGFCKWQLKPGVYTRDCPLADQFIVCVRRHGRTVFQQVLSLESNSGEALRTWNWRFCGSYAFYHGLYPRAWTVYDLKGQDIILTCRQISPIFPHNYKDTSIPAAVFVWTIENKRKDDAEVTIAFTMENGIGDHHERRGSAGLCNEQFDSNEHETPVKGIVMYNTTYHKMPYTMTIASSEKHGVTVSRCTSFNPLKNGSEVWQPLMTSGQLHSDAEKSHLTGKGEAIACAIASTCLVKGESHNDVEFCLTWDMPKIHFGDSRRFYNRRYTRWFGSDGKAGPKLADYSLNSYLEWEEKIMEWQMPVLSNKGIPSWYKSALYNELYYLTDGGTVWLESDESTGTSLQNGYNNGHHSNHDSPNHKTFIADTTREEEIRNCKHIMEYGRFAYLEGQEYKMYNTYDVHFYASVALVHLWPQLEISLQYDITASVLHANLEERKYLMDGVWAPTKTPNCVPHDIGCPDDEPWLSVNAYFVHDTADWRDLNPKYVLQAFRDYHVTKDKVFLETVWPVVKTVMANSMRHDRDGDGLIENSGAADQTFDGWCVEGPSAYCGGLWLAAVRFVIEGAEIFGENDIKEKYSDILKRGTEAYGRLWNGKYYDYDSSRHSRRSSVMADQCAGQWYLSDASINDVHPEENIQSALKTIFELNVQKYDDGKHGAVNGMRPNGTVDTCSVQSVEVWTGVTYALAATMIHKGLVNEAFQTASGIYRTCWERYGMSYQTPEAFRKNRTYRSLAYMRPLSIWGMQRALENMKESAIKCNGKIPCTSTSDLEAI